ncbi:MAG: phage shock protein PspA [Pseudomonadota bacterium]
MGIFSRLSDIINSNINAMLDRAENPEKIIRLIIQEMEDTLVEVRATAAKAIAEKKELLRKQASLEADAAEWARRAEFAISREREDLARGALLAKRRANEAVGAIQEELEAIETGLDKTGADLERLQSKLAEAKAKQTALNRRRETALGRDKVRKHLYDPRVDAALDRYESVQRKVDEIEGRVEAYDLGGPPPRPDQPQSLDSAFAELEAEGQIEQELEKIRQRLGANRANGGQASA